MPITHRIDRERGLLLTTAEEEVTWADLEAHWAAELADGAEVLPELVDGTRATIAFGTAEVRRMVDLLHRAAARGPLGPTAVVVRTDVGFGMVRMFGILVEPFAEVRPFRDAAAAEAWLSGQSRADGIREAPATRPVGPSAGQSQ